MAYLVINTIPPGEADDFAEKAVNEKAAACATIIRDNTSFYWWQGKVNKEQEDVILFKVSSKKMKKLMSYIKAHHPYDVPEIIAFQIDRINKSYARWLVEN
ncbi:divalent-cation tolerance protein CutA [Spirochaetota bacterium]